MPADFLQPWSNFFVAELGAAAALTGLLFVAVSINLARILQFPNLPARSAEALLDLLSVVVVSTFALIPRQTATSLGIEIASTGFLTWLWHTATMARTRKFDKAYVKLSQRLAVNQPPPLTYILAGVLLIAGHPSGMDWLVAAILLSFATGVFGAWVLLIEIQR